MTGERRRGKKAAVSQKILCMYSPQIRKKSLSKKYKITLPPYMANNTGNQNCDIETNEINTRDTVLLPFVFVFRL